MKNVLDKVVEEIKTHVLFYFILLLFCFILLSHLYRASCYCQSFIFITT